MDHVIPTAAGGKWTWENLVTACTLCNCRKGSKSVEQLGWKLRKKPAVSRLPLSLCVQPHSPSHVRDENRMPAIPYLKVCLCCAAQAQCLSSGVQGGEPACPQLPTYKP